MATNVSEKEARDVVEAAREADWKLPSFGKQLFLGDFRLDLIHPHPRLESEAIEKGERFLSELQAVLAEQADPLEIERESKIPDRVVDGVEGHRRARDEDVQTQSRRAVPRAMGQRRRHPLQRRAKKYSTASTNGSRKESSTQPATAR
jgi:hypothetical protein